MKITVTIPVGPLPHHRRWLAECLESVARQTRPADEVLIIDDMAGLEGDALAPLGDAQSRVVSGHAQMGHPSIPFGGCYTHIERPYPEKGEGWWRTYGRIWRAPWRMGVGGAFNAGVGLALHDAVFMLGSDDTMMPECLELCETAFEANAGRDAYYFVGVRYSDGRPDQYVPCNEAMVTKGLWRETGGFAPESGSGACDAALISAMMVHLPDRLVLVNADMPLVTYRVHDETDTANRGPWQGVILQTRDILTETWKPAVEWGAWAL